LLLQIGSDVTQSLAFFKVLIKLREILIGELTPVIVQQLRDNE